MAFFGQFVDVDLFMWVSNSCAIFWNKIDSQTHIYIECDKTLKTVQYIGTNIWDIGPKQYASLCDSSLLY